MAYKLTLTPDMETVMADAMWWKFNSAVPSMGVDPPTADQKQAHAQARVKEFLLGIVREYLLHQATEAAVVTARDQINAELTAAGAAMVMERLDA
jgi:hypothetical protein